MGRGGDVLDDSKSTQSRGQCVVNCGGAEEFALLARFSDGDDRGESIVVQDVLGNGEIDANEFTEGLVGAEVARGDAEAFKHFEEFAVLWEEVSTGQGEGEGEGGTIDEGKTREGSWETGY